MKMLKAIVLGTPERFDIEEEIIEAAIVVDADCQVDFAKAGPVDSRRSSHFLYRRNARGGVD